MRDRLATIIRDGLNTEFGNPDLLPGIVISSIANEIYKHRWEIYNNVQEEYDLEDIDTTASANNISLTNREREIALHRYKKLEDSNLETLDYIINEIIEEREQAKADNEKEGG